MKTMKAAKLMTTALGAMMLIVTFRVSAVDAPPRAKTTVVTDENYALAETDEIMTGYLKKIAAATNTSGVGVFMHNKKGADPKDRTIVRINFDTLYSFAIVDLTQDATLTMPETNGRYQSAWTISEDAYYPGAFTTPGEHKITQEWIGGARYAVIVIRTQANTRDPADVAKVNALQEQLKLTQKDKGFFAPVNHWDQKEVSAMGAKYMKIANKMSTSKMFGKKGEISLKDHNAGVAFGWGGFTPDQAVYPQYFPKTVAHQTLMLKDVPIKTLKTIWKHSMAGTSHYACIKQPKRISMVVGSSLN